MSARAKRTVVRFPHAATRATGDLPRKGREVHSLSRYHFFDYLNAGTLFSVLTSPVIYSLLFPLAVLDVWVTLYQALCFPIYRVPQVPRRRYFAIDRHKLAYLNTIEKANCTFCSYANGVIAYVQEVAARTEQYWCPIKHARAIPAPHSLYGAFLEYGDANSYRRKLSVVRRLPKTPTSAGTLAHRRRGNG